MKISKNLSAKYYQKNKEKIQKKLLKDIRIFSKEEKEKKNNMVMNVTKISQKMKNKSLLTIEKKYYRMRKNDLL